MPFMWSLLNPFYLSVTRCTTQRQRREREEGGGNRREKEKKKKEKHASPGLAWWGWIPQENSSDKGAQTSNWCIIPLNSKDTRARKRNVSAWACETRNTLCSYCTLCVPPPPHSPKCALKDRSIIWGDEVIHATCSITSSDFGHGLVKAEP